MKKTNIIAQDTITIINRTILHNSDRKLLTILYQPIIGGMAINLYLTLWALLDIKEISSNLIDFKKVMNQTGYTINEVMEAKKNLEAIGLIKTYMRSIEKQNDYLIAIYSPLDAGRFFSNPLFCNLLLTSVGKVEFESIRNLFRVPNVDIKDFEEVSARFDEVFTTSADLIMQSDMIQKRRQKDISFVKTLDIESILERIPEIHDNHIIVPEDVKKFVADNAYIYNYNESIVIDLIRHSLDQQNRIDKRKVSQNFSNYFKIEYKNKIPELIQKNKIIEYQAKFAEVNNLSKWECHCPAVFLRKRNKAQKLSELEMEMLVYLMIDLELNPGVINVLIDYVLSTQENKLPKKYVEAIATAWKREKIETVEQARARAKRDYQTRNNTVKKQTTVIKKTNEVADWFGKEQTVKTDANKEAELKELMNQI